MLRKAITRTLFTGFDLLQGGGLSRYYQQVSYFNASKAGNKSDDYVIHEPLKAYLQNWGFGNILECLPLMTKQDVISWTEKVAPQDIYSWAYTGGSYGEPLRVPYSKQRNLVRTATFKFFNEQAGYHIGDSFALIRAKDKSALLKFLRNETIIIPHNAFWRNIVQIHRQLVRNKVKVLIGYPSVLYELATFYRVNPLLLAELSVESMISASEMLEDEKRQQIFEVFQCPFVDRYSNEEVGLIAQQRQFGGEYFVNRFGVVVEVLDPDTLQATSVGEVGRVVVSDYLNDLVPMIRYDTGDLAVVSEYDQFGLKSISKIIGRVAETLYDTSGNPISSLALGPCIYKPFSRAAYSYQFQLAQVADKAYELRIKAGEVDVKLSVLDEIKSALGNILGETMQLAISFVADIPAQPSGKRPVYKNEMTS
ncbi:MAG: hypothetical protein AAFO02_19835 [Bacteroidota bacterium]